MHRPPDAHVLDVPGRLPARRAAARTLLSTQGWWAVLALGPAVAALALLARPGAGTGVLRALGIACAAAVVAGIVLHHAHRPVPWFVLAAALVLLAVTRPSGAVAIDTSYALLVAGLVPVSLTGGSDGRHPVQREAWLDSLLVAGAAALAVWAFVVGGRPLGAASAARYGLDAALLGVAARLVLDRRLLGAGAGLLAPLGVIGLLAAEAAHAALRHAGALIPAGWAWLALLVAAAALHQPGPGTRPAEGAGRFPWLAVVIVGACALVGPAMLLTGHTPPGLAGAAAALTVVVVVRLVLLVRAAGAPAGSPVGGAVPPAAARGAEPDNLAQLATGLAHDFNNVLSATQMYSGVLDRGLRGHPGSPVGPGRGETLARDVAKIREAAERGASLVHQFTLLARGGGSDLAVVDLNQCARNLAEWIADTLGPRVSLALRLDPEALLVRMDAGGASRVDRVLMNLVINARDAMPGGGRLTLVTEEVQLDRASLAGALPPGSYIRLAVVDTGSGMPAEVAERAFEPYFTTKPGQGSGLGLATVRSIVLQAGGEVRLSTAPGHGTTVEVFLPAALQLAPGRAPGGRTGCCSRRRATPAC